MRNYTYFRSIINPTKVPNVIFIAILSLSSLLLPPLASKINGFQNGNLLLIIFYSSVFLKSGITITKSKITTGLHDYALLLFTIYLVVCSCFTAQTWIHNDDFLFLLGCICIYFAFRDCDLNTLKIVFSLISILGLLYSFLGVIYFENVLKSKNLKGFLSILYPNPSHLAGYAVSIFPIGIGIFQYYLQKNTSSIKKIVAGLIILALFFSIILLNSRAAWLACIVSLTFYFHKELLSFLKKISSPLKIGLFFLSVCIFLGLLYYYKMDSANGRWLIWKISLDIWKDHPFFGIGYGNFKIEFLNYQARYFSENLIDYQQGMLAGNTYFAFNTFIRILVETGLIGLLLFISVIYMFLRIKIQKDNSTTFVDLRMAKSGILGILCFGLFSYPFAIPSILLNLFLYFLTVSAYWSKTYLTSIPTSKKIVYRLLYVTICCISLYNLIKLQYKSTAIQSWKKAALVVTEFPEEAFPIYKQIYPALSQHGSFLFNYGSELSLDGQHEKAIKILEASKQYFNHIDVYLHLGNSYQALGHYAHAKSSFLTAERMIPHRFNPKYALFQLYEEIGETAEMKKMGKIILAMPIKIPSKRTNIIRKKVKRSLQKIN